MNKFFSSLTLRTVINNFIVAVLAYSAGYQVTSLFSEHAAEIGGLWAVISGVFVVEDKRADTMKTAHARLIGSFIGCAISGVYLYLFPFNVFGYAACIAVGIIVCKLFGLAQYLKLVGITISVVMIVSIVDNNISPFQNALLRFVESVIGTIIAVVVVHISNLIYADEK